MEVRSNSVGASSYARRELSGRRSRMPRERFEHLVPR